MFMIDGITNVRVYQVLQAPIPNDIESFKSSSLISKCHSIHNDKTLQNTHLRLNFHLL